MNVQPVAPAQHESLVDLLCELHGHYHGGAAVARALVREHLQANLLAEGSPQCLLVASDDGARVLGLAAVTLVHSLVDPTPGGRTQLQLKELYVRSGSRGQGIGAALMAGVARHALARSCGRIDWPVNAANAAGIAFYEGLGAARVADRLAYRLGANDIRRLADRLAPAA